ncbi:MAG: right-handed parallel beta-helix repeat-containing protein, partial [Candidatus Hydrogenedentes bacterium]|nr:right-handed parallel beta-helix repeat-containing protein [Candidatus Hydrogenedentota bacterium]
MTMIAIVLAMLCTRSTQPPSEADPAAMAEVGSGTRTTANAAWWGFDSSDATDALQSAVDSGAKTILVPYMGADWNVTPITLCDDIELILEPGVVVCAKKGEFKGKGDSLFSATNAHDVTISGYGATLRMQKDDYQSEDYEPAEWRSTLDFMGCSNIRVSGLKLESSGGDGIYLGSTEEQNYCKDVTIRDVTCRNLHRQGISVVCAVDLLIENCVMSDTGGTSPEAGIDFEPNDAGEHMENCVVRNCRMLDNAGAGILVYLKALTGKSTPVSLRFERCLVQGGKDSGIGMGALRDEGPQGNIEFDHCTVENSPGGGLYLYDKSPDAARVRFVGCAWKGVGVENGKPAKHSPLLLHRRRDAIAERLGGIDFDNCYVVDEFDRPALQVDTDDEVTLTDV